MQAPVRKLAAWMLIATATVAVLLMGSVDSWELAVVALLAAITLSLAVSTGGPLPLRREAVVLLVTGVGLTAFSAVQCLPLPHGAVAQLSPHASQIWERSLHPFAEPGPAWHALSLDPRATLIETLKGFTYVSCFVSALYVASHRSGARLLTSALIVLPVVVVTVALIHEELGLQRVWGLYAPKTAVSSISPLMNANQLSGFCAIGLLCATGSTLSTAPVLRRSVTAVIAVGLVGAEVWFASRGALGAVVAGLTVVAWYSLVGRGKASLVVAKWVVPVVLAFAGVAMMIIASSQAVRSGLEERDISKLIAAKSALIEMAPHYWLTGTGRGAFQSTFPEYAPPTGFFVFTHPESVIAEWVTGWGFAVGVLALCAVAYALRPAALVTPSKATVGVYAALVALALQNLVDFSSETPGVMVSLVVAAAIVVSGTGGAHRAWRPPRAVVWCASALTVALGAVIVLDRRHDLEAEQDHLASNLHSGMPAVVTIGEVRSAMSRHPAEPYFRYVGALMVSRQPKGNVPLWVGSTLERSPRYGPAHVVLARWLRPRSPSQSRLEYRLAQEEGLPTPLPFSEYEALVEDARSAIEVAVPDIRGVTLLDDLGRHLALRQPASAALIDQEILRRDPHNTNALVRDAQSKWLDLAAGAAAPWCEGSNCVVDVQQAAAMAKAVAPDRCEGYVVEARLLAAVGERDAAMRTMHTALDNVTDWVGCDEQLARLAIDAHREVEASDAIDALAHHPCAGNVDCASNLVEAAALETARGSPNRALVYLRRATTLEPGRGDALKALAATAAQLGLQREADDAYSRLRAAAPANRP